MTTLLFIRHGQTPNNVIGALDTALPGAGLTTLGQRQAADLERRLAGERIDHIVASQHLRARLTATPLAEARGLDITQDAGFGEIEAGDLEMARTREAADRYLDTAFAWATGDLEPRLPGGPSGRHTLSRFDAALTAALAELGDTAAPGAPGDDATLVIVSHGAVIRLWVTSRCAGISPHEAGRRRLLNTAVLRVEGGPDDWRFVSWTDPDLVDSGADDPTSQADEDPSVDRATPPSS